MEIAKLLASKIRRKIVAFFHENQASIDTPRGVATWIGEDRSKVKKALEELVDAGVLIAHRSSSTSGYSYTRNPRIISKISEIIDESSTA